MNNGFESGSSRQPVSNFPAAWKLGRAGLLALVSVTLVTIEIFPASNGPFAVLASEIGLPGAAHRFPKGQLQADAKTLVTTLQWLITPQADHRSTALPAGAGSTNQLHAIRQPAGSADSGKHALFLGFIVSPACGEDAASQRRIG